MTRIRTPVAAGDPAPSQQHSGLGGEARLSVTLGAAAAVVSLTGSWIPSLWGDEAASAMSAQRPIPSLFRMLGHVDAVHGTYYLGLHLWVSVFGASPFSLRFPSAVAVGLTVAAVVLLVYRLGSRRLAIAAGIICAVIPRLTAMGAEARSFAFSAAIAAWSTLVFVELIHRRGRTTALWVGYGALLAMGVYLFLYTGLFALVHLVILAVWRPPGRRLYLGWLWTVLAVIAVTSPLLVLAALERNQLAYLSTAPQVDPIIVSVGLWFGTAWFAVAAWALLIAVAVFAFADYRRAGPSRAWRTARSPSLVLVAASWLVVPSAVLLGSAFFVSYFTARYLSFCAPAAAILMAVALDRLGALHPPVLPVGVLVIVALAVPGYLGQRQPYSQNDSDWADISATLAVRATPGDAVVFDEAVRPSRRTRLAMHTYPAGFSGLRDVTLETPYQESRTWYDSAYSVRKALALGRFDTVRRVWLVDYAIESKRYRYGLQSLQHAGFRLVRQIDEHRSVIYQLER